MRTFKMSVRAVLYKEEGSWIAHCLEFDLIGHGATKRKSLKALSQAIAVQLQASIEDRNPGNLFRPAPGEYFERFAEGKHIAVGTLSVKVKRSPYRIETIEAREYCESDAGRECIPT
jgi:predicted RNase H-like HicB family nuclease